MFKRIILGLLLFVGLVGGTTLVFSTGFIFTKEVDISTVVSPNIYLDDQVLSSTVIGYKSTYDIRDAVIHSTCDTTTQFLEKFEGVYYFKLTYVGESCRNKTIVLKHDDQLLAQTSMQVNIVTDTELFNLMVDHPTGSLQKLYRSLQKTMSKNTLYAELNSDEIGKYIKYRKNQRRYQESSYQSSLLQGIISGRSKKYISPVPGRTLSREFSKIPNSGRGYRASYTDGIHHGWDIDGERGEQIVALDDGIIVRIVRGFQYSDLDRILRGTLSEEEKLKNLDILRGNQVWIKTTKGEVVFYSHLEDVSDFIQEGDMIERGTPVGTIGVSGVPEVGYDDYHLHFAVQTNPFDADKAGTYNFGDYMKWDWKFRGETFEYILENQGEVFE